LPKKSRTKGKQTVQRAAAWSETAFKEVYSRYIKPLNAYILQRVRNHHDAEDLTAQVFLQVLDRLEPKDANSPKLAAWLFASARNATANFARRGRHFIPIPLEALAEQADDCDASNPGAAMLGEEELNRLLTAIGDLPDERRQAIVLRFVECLPHSEIADALGRTEGSARVLVHRTLAELRREVS
jgi:RNA polymerase sigma-70 factor (ECF subfamily)